MTVEEYVGIRIRERREELGMGAVEFGSRLGELLGKPWPRQAVSAAELGKRTLGAAEMVAISHVLRTTVSQLFTPPAEVTEITMPSGAVVPSSMVFAALTAARREDWNLTAIWETLSDLKATTAQSHQLAEGLDTLIAQRVADGGAISAPLAPSYGQGVVSSAGRPIATEEPLTQPVVTAIVTSELGVLVGRRNDGKPPWTFISGEQDAVQDESPQDTAVREVKEETGLEITAGETIGERDHPRTGRHMIYVAARPVRGTEVIVGDQDELAEVRWVSLPEADELMAEYGMFEPVHDYLQREIGG